MRKISLSLIFALSLVFSIQLSAQHSCGMTHEDMTELSNQMDINRAEMANYVYSRDVAYVPIRFHLVANSSGEGRGTVRNALTAICILNENYVDQDIIFYLKGINNINNSSLYDEVESFSGQLAISSNLEYDAINIFVVNDISSGSGGTTLAYYQPPAGTGGTDYIVSLKSQVTDETTLTHEIGHYFTLMHPFYGWDFNPWDPDIHGNPLNSWTSPQGIEVEAADASNCATAADKMCDTPADYNFLFFQSGCNYIADAKDPSGGVVVPDEQNIMNYFQSCSNYSFTGEQKAEIQVSLNSSSRNYLGDNNTANDTEITDAITLTSPGQLQTVAGYNYVTLEWSPVAGASKYLVEIAGTQTITKIVTNPYTIFEDELEPNSTYLWRVKPFNDAYTCANSSLQQIFKTPGNTVAVKEVQEIQDWQVRPNPVFGQDELQIEVDASKTFLGEISLINIAGQPVKNMTNQFLSGRSHIHINVSDIPAGLYNVVIKTDVGISNQKLVISK